ncbi:hypothetical protein F1729_17455 [Gimesia maris]|nr:hypothetical protein F1729_17455 [Gimesia maris]
MRKKSDFQRDSRRFLRSLPEILRQTVRVIQLENPSQMTRFLLPAQVWKSGRGGKRRLRNFLPLPQPSTPCGA